jgi:hypothetical protein
MYRNTAPLSNNPLKHVRWANSKKGTPERTKGTPERTRHKTTTQRINASATTCLSQDLLALCGFDGQ